VNVVDTGVGFAMVSIGTDYRVQSNIVL